MTSALADRLPGRLQATFVPSPTVPASGHLALWGTADPAADAAALGFEDPRLASLRTVLPRTPRAYRRLAPADVPAVLVPVEPAVAVLAGLDDPSRLARWARPSDAVVGWSLAAKLALELVAAGRLVPAVAGDGDRAGGHWRLAAAGDPRLAELADALPPAAHALRRPDGRLWSARALVAAFGDAVADACARGRDADVVRDAAGAADPRRAAEALDAWTATVASPGHTATARLCLRLDPPPAEPADDTDEGDGADDRVSGGDGAPSAWRTQFLLQAADDPSLLVPAEDVWSRPDAAVVLGSRRLADAQEALVGDLATAARLFAPLDRALDEPRPAGLDLDADEAAALLGEAADGLAAAGIGLQLPAELTSAGRQRLRARLRVGGPSTSTPGVVTAGGLTEESLAAFEWEVAIGDTTLTPDEFAQIVAMKRPLVAWRGRWVRVDPDEVVHLADVTRPDRRMAPADAVAAGLAGETELDGAGTVEVVPDGALADLLDRLRTAAAVGAAGAADRAPRVDRIEAILRPYQRRGVAWLQMMAELGLGAVLADDMGLGKTLSTIALLADRPSDRPHLVVCPTSVVGNWERELARFAPSLEVVRHHGPGRPAAPEQFPPGAVAVTSYGTMRRDAELLAGVDWDVVTLDEAQRIKNHTARAARVARQLPSQVRLALTGTPVENRLAELWAILDWAVPGLLGGFSRFRESYAVPIERWRDPDAAARLRAVTAPFVLRRVKTDPAVAGDLPPKHQHAVVCGLTREQATLYQAAVDATFAEELGEGIERRGRILKLLTALKQVCNHPAQYLHEPGPMAGRSGKVDRLTEMLAEVVADGDRALVFTQYRQMGSLLAAHLAATLDLPGVPFLHGGVSRTGRERMVDAFQTDPAAPPVLLVSLKAGGVGLNLTAATEVFHFDRWWNPAVEDQATDRAYRIGQHRPVTVHTMVTAGTLEERIATVLDDKRALADAVIGTGETWLTELGDDELRELVALDTSDVADDEDQETAA